MKFKKSLNTYIFYFLLDNETQLALQNYHKIKFDENLNQDKFVMISNIVILFLFF